MTHTPSATGRRLEVDGVDSVVFTRTFPAGVDDVWAAVTRSHRLGRWIGTWTGDPDSGSVQLQMAVEGDGAAAETVRIRMCEPPQRLAVDVHSDGAPEPWHLALRLRGGDESTTLTFSQSVPDAELAAAVGPGWDYYLDRLVVVETGGEVTSLDWEQYADLAPAYLALFA